MQPIPPPASPVETLQLRLHGPAHLPTLIYLPGLHGDWTLVHSFRIALANRVRFVEITYPRTLTWSLADYANAIVQFLRSHEIRHGWLLGESFGSQIVWPLLQNPEFKAAGIILAGGFIKHPIPFGPRLAELFIRFVPWPFSIFLLRLYGRLSRLRLRQPPPEVLARFNEFLARRTEPDRQAILHRLRLITASDPRPLARAVQLPVFQLTGWFDPVVPWPPVRTWLRQNCPGYRATRVIPYADHTILCSSPQAAATQVLNWIN